MPHVLRELDRCVFCDGGDVTEEHLIADWAHRAFAKSRKPNGLMSAAIAQGGRLMKTHDDPVGTAKVVCRDCNNRWLSEVDNRASRVLKPLVRGEREVELDRAGQTAVAAWIYKCALIFDVVEYGHGGPLASQRPLFRDSPLAGPGCAITVGPALPPPSLTVGDPPTTVNLWMLGVRPANGTMHLTVDVQSADGSETTRSEQPTRISIPGYQVMVGALNAYLGGRSVFPIAPESLVGYAFVWPARTEPVTVRAASLVTAKRAA